MISVLFSRTDSIYKTLGVDVWDAERDATNWPGGNPIIAHPPCRAWGRMRQFAKPADGEKELALWAVDQVRKFGGVLEHPERSTLWNDKPLPKPDKNNIKTFDEFGGFTIVVDQHWFGHRAQKRTWLYICGCTPSDIPQIPLKLGAATHCIRPTKSYPRLPSVTKTEREATPVGFAKFLIEIARNCSFELRNVA